MKYINNMIWIEVDDEMVSCQLFRQHSEIEVRNTLVVPDKSLPVDSFFPFYKKF